MIFQSKKIVGYLFILILLSVVYFGCKFLFSLPFFVGQGVNVEDIVASPSTMPDTKPYVITKMLGEAEEQVDFSKPVIINEKPYYLIFADEMGEIKNWLSGKGYITSEDRAAYELYSDKVLKELANNGDLVALDVLISKAIQAHDKKTAMFYQTLAAIHGSTTALDSLTLYISPQIEIHNTEAAARPQALETLAITKVIELRGDRTLANVSRRDLINSYKYRYDVNLVLTPDEQDLVNKRAQVIYDELQNLRHKKGLGDFHNAEPNAIKKIFGLD